ncbi:MAG: hypothetical protein AAB470_03110 [Patescibacteria group bacterium]
MKKFGKTSLLSIPITLLIIVSVVNINSVSAITGGNSGSLTGSDSFALQNPLKVDSIGGLVQNFIEIFSYIVILFAVLLLVWVGLRFIMVRGNSEEIKKLKDWLLFIVVGVAVVIGARIIIQIVINTLASTGTVDQRTIQSVQKAVNGK